MGSALSTFNDFVQSTGPAFLTSAEDVVNEAVKNKYVLGRFLRNQPSSKVMQGGRVIRDEVMFDEQSTFTGYQPNDTFTWSNPQVLTEWEVAWRFYVDHMSWTDQELELNAGANLSTKARHQVFKRVKRVKEQRLWTSMLNGMENLLSASPEVASMETATGTAAYSIPAFLNEESDGLFYKSGTPTGKTIWTTVEGINPVTKSKWACKNERYTTDTDVGTDMVSAFDQMWHSVRFMPPPTKEQYFENVNFSSQFILCSKKGITAYVERLRAQQDLFVTPGRQDPDYNAPKYAGIDLVYWSNLDTAALYSPQAANGQYVTEGQCGSGAGSDPDNGSGPRYYWINSQYLTPVFHTKRYMYQHPVKSHPNQPFTHVRPVDCWMNLVCRSRQRQGIVSPTGQAYPAY